MEFKEVMFLEYSETEVDAVPDNSIWYRDDMDGEPTGSIYFQVSGSDVTLVKKTTDTDSGLTLNNGAMSVDESLYKGQTGYTLAQESSMLVGFKIGSLIAAFPSAKYLGVKVYNTSTLYVASSTLSSSSPMYLVSDGDNKLTQVYVYNVTEEEQTTVSVPATITSPDELLISASSFIQESKE